MIYGLDYLNNYLDDNSESFKLITTYELNIFTTYNAVLNLILT